MSDAHTYHIWTKSIPEESLPFYKKLAKAYCPRAYTFLAYGYDDNLHLDDDSKTRRPPTLITESLAEPLEENVRPSKPKPEIKETDKPVTVSYSTVPPCGEKQNGTACLHAKKEPVITNKIKKMKKNNITSNEIKNRRFKTKMLEDAKKMMFIENRAKVLKRKSTSTTTEKSIFIKIDIDH